MSEEQIAAGEELRPMDHSAQNRCFGCGPANGHGLHLKFLLADDGWVVSQPIISDDFEGPRGYLHGGIIATLLDETMSKSVRARGVTAMTRRIEVDYLKPVPSGVPIRLEGRVSHHEGRKLWTDARILDQDGVELAKGKGLFIEVRPK